MQPSSSVLEHLPQAFNSLLAQLDDQGIPKLPTKQEILDRLVERQVRAVELFIAQELAKPELKGFENFHFVADHRIELNYNDQVHPEAIERVIHDLYLLGWEDVVFHPHDKGLTKIELRVQPRRPERV